MKRHGGGLLGLVDHQPVFSDWFLVMGQGIVMPRFSQDVFCDRWHPLVRGSRDLSTEDFLAKSLAVRPSVLRAR